MSANREKPARQRSSIVFSMKLAFNSQWTLFSWVESSMCSMEGEQREERNQQQQNEQPKQIKCKGLCIRSWTCWQLHVGRISGARGRTVRCLHLQSYYVIIVKFWSTSSSPRSGLADWRQADKHPSTRRMFTGSFSRWASPSEIILFNISHIKYVFSFI